MQTREVVDFQAPGLGLWLTNAAETGPSAAVLRMNCAARTDGEIAQGLRCPVVVYCVLTFGSERLPLLLVFVSAVSH